jgi:hypothetical protein
MRFPFKHALFFFLSLLFSSHPIFSFLQAEQIDELSYTVCELAWEDNCDRPPVGSWPNTDISFIHLIGRGVGFETGFTSLDLFATPQGIYTDKILPFLDARGHVFNNGKFAFNLGAGGRYLWESNRIALGANVFYDYRHGRHEADFNQLGMGLEALGGWWKFIANGYFPIGKKNTRLHGRIPDDFTEDYYDSGCREFERALTGFDAEAGMYFLTRDPSNPCDYDFYVGLGGYYFHRSHGSQAGGAQARVVMELGNYVSLELLGSTDPVFHQRLAGQVEIRIPLPSSERSYETVFDDYSGFIDIAYSQVQRREIIVLNKQHIK